MVLGNFQYRGVLQIVEQRPAALVVGVRVCVCGGGLLGRLFSLLSFFISFALSLGDGPI